MEFTLELELSSWELSTIRTAASKRRQQEHLFHISTIISPPPKRTFCFLRQRKQKKEKKSSKKYLPKLLTKQWISMPHTQGTAERHGRKIIKKESPRKKNPCQVYRH